MPDLSNFRAYLQQGRPRSRQSELMLSEVWPRRVVSNELDGKTSDDLTACHRTLNGARHPFREDPWREALPFLGEEIRHASNTNSRVEQHLAG